MHREYGSVYLPASPAGYDFVHRWPAVSNLELAEGAVIILKLINQRNVLYPVHKIRNRLEARHGLHPNELVSRSLFSFLEMALATDTFFV